MKYHDFPSKSTPSPHCRISYLRIYFEGWIEIQKISLFNGEYMKMLRKFKFWLAGGTVSVLCFSSFLLAVSASSTGNRLPGAESMGQPLSAFFMLFLLGLISGGSGTVLWFKFGRKSETLDQNPEVLQEEIYDPPPQPLRTIRPPWRFPWE